MGQFVLLGTVARNTSNNKIFRAIRAAARQGYYVIDVVSIANFSTAIIAFAFLGLVLSLNISGSMGACSIAFAGAIVKFVTSDYKGVGRFPNAVTFFNARLKSYAVGVISIPNKFWMGGAERSSLFANAFFVGLVIVAGILGNSFFVIGAIPNATFLAGGFEFQDTFAISIAIKIFGCFGLCLTTLGTGFRGIIEAHRNLPFLCRAGDVSQTLPGVSIGFTPVSIPSFMAVGQ